MANRKSRAVPTAEQAGPVTTARQAVERLVGRLATASGRDIPTVRSALRVKGDARFGKSFKGDAFADHVGIATETFKSITDLARDDAWRHAYELCDELVHEALRDLNEVIIAFGEEPLPSPQLRRGTDPFERIGEELWLFRRQSLTQLPLPQPSLADFRSGKVVESRAEKVFSKLEAERVCYLRGISAYGKTTTSLVVAFRQISRGMQAYYLDLGDLSSGSEKEVTVAFQTLLSRGPRQIIIVDNAHRGARLIRSLRRKWIDVSREGRPRLLIVGTEVSYSTSTSANEVMDWPEEDTVDLRLTSDNFRDIAIFYISRESGRTVNVPQIVQSNWSVTFANHLHAFTFALLARARDLGKSDNWALSRGHGLQWIYDNWLCITKEGYTEQVGRRDLEQLLTLCVFAETDFELSLTKGALADGVLCISHYRALGVVKERVRMRECLDPITRQVELAPFDTVFQLMEHGWGELILEAANVDERQRSRLRVGALKRSMDLALAAANRCADIGNLRKLERLFHELDKTGDWLARTASAGPRQANGWLSFFIGAGYKDYVQVLLVRLVTLIEQDCDSLNDFEFAQLAWLLEQLENVATGSVLQRLVSVLSGFTPRPDSTLVEPPIEVTADHLRLFSVLSHDSPCRSALAAMVCTSLPDTLDRILMRGLRPLSDLMRGMATHVPEGIELALDALESRDRHERLRTVIERAGIPDFLPLPFVVRRPPGVTNERAAAIFFGHFKGTDWTRFVNDRGGGLWGAHWLVKCFSEIDMVVEAEALAHLLATRAKQADLSVIGHRGTRKIEMVAHVCAACTEPNVARSYFSAMEPTIAWVIRNEGVYAGLVAKGLGVLAACDAINADTDTIRRAARYRLLQLPKLSGSEEEKQRELGGYVKFLGSLSTICKPSIFAPEIIRFADYVGDLRLLSNVWIRLPDTTVEVNYVPPYQTQYWQGLRAVCDATGRCLNADPELIREMRIRWADNLAYEHLRRANRHRAVLRAEALASWLDACLASRPVALIPTPASA